ncbi:MAG TPA: gliding motility-associated C-terminal domain-containing protein, partial [Bacteroidia bacterium]|nr:gliding motility-associated C-terminal domain-containing protein [Bacteroidia bacterium]
GCSDSITVNITEPMAALTTALTVTQQVNCFAGEDGAIDLTVTGGTVPYTYLWSNTQTTEDMNQLMAGTYTVTVTDLNGCSAEGQIDILEPSQPLTGTANILSNVFCNGGSNGSIDLVMNGGTAPYVYLWSTGETTEDISGLSSGIYSVTVTDANGCTFTTSGGIGQPSQQLSASMNIQNVLCFSGTNGFIDLNVTGGTAPYTFNWSNGSNTEDLGALGSGTYTVTIIDANGCDTTLTGTVDQPTAPLIPAVAVDQNVSCYAGSNGSLSLTVTGGTLPYTYLWNTGSTTSAISNLPAGMYTLTVTDANGCNAIIAQTVTQPNAPLNAPLVVTQNVSCFSGNDGSILANAIGGTSPYTYLWNTGASGNSISNLTSGIYTVTVTDTLGCVFTDSIEVTQPAAALSLTGSTTLADCLYGIGGSATVSATGGTAPYSYNWNTGASTNNIGNAAPGAYTVTVTDANGCSDILNLNVGNQSTISIYPGPVEICSGQTALLEVDSIPGATYQWYYGGAPLLGAVTNSFQTPAQGYYYVTVTTPCGIFTSDSVTVTVHSMNGVTISSNQVICPPESVQLIATGGTSYQWSPATNINFTNVANPSVSPTASTLYSVVISDAYGCTAQLSVNVTVDCDSLFIPNGFSPNEDGINDGYVIDGILDYPNNKIWIYNRWGNLIYKTKGYANQWDGTCNVQGIYFGTKVPSGTYFYILELGVPSEKPRAGYLIIRH